MTRYAFYILSLLAVLAVLAGCRQEAVDTLSAGKVLQRGMGGAPATLDPARAEDIHAYQVLADLYEGLVTVTADGALVPGAAASWQVSDDGRTYTFNLREGARWSNGDPLTSADFLRGLRRAAAPSTASPTAFLLRPIDGMRGIEAGERASDSLAVAAPDPRTLRIELEAPAPQFLSILSMPVAAPVHADMEDTRRFAEPEHFIGNGPYRLADYRAGDTILLTKNPFFHAAPSIGIDAVRYHAVADPATEYKMYRVGELDITQTVPSANFVSLRQSKTNELRVAPYLALYYLALDVTDSPLDQPALRRALSLAVDREQLVRLLARGEQPAYGVVPPGVANHRNVQPEWRDQPHADRVLAAREALATAGMDAAPPALKLTYDTGGVHERIALIVADMWREHLGIEVTLEKLEWKLFLDTRARRHAWQVMRFSWFGDYDDPTTFLSLFRSDDDNNLSGYRNAAFDALLDSAASLPPSNERERLLSDAERTLLEDMPIVPLYFYVSKHLVRDGIDGFANNPLDRHPTRYLSWVD